MTRVVLEGRVGVVVDERAGMWLVRWLDTGDVGRILKTEWATVSEGAGRPRKHKTNAARQHAYRQRQKALRNSQKGVEEGEE